MTAEQSSQSVASTELESANKMQVDEPKDVKPKVQSKASGIPDKRRTLPVTTRKTKAKDSPTPSVSKLSKATGIHAPTFGIISASNHGLFYSLYLFKLVFI